MVHSVTWADARLRAEDIARHTTAATVFGVPQGGIPVAALVAAAGGIGHVVDPAGIDPTTLIVDDVVDSGFTRTAWKGRGCGFDALYRKPWAPPGAADDAPVIADWIWFPWENRGAPTDAVVRLLQHIGEDPTRDGLRDTPDRVVRAWSELTCGYRQDPAAILSRTFGDITYDEMVVVRRVPFSSMCEHHMLLFAGHATVAYIPASDGPVVGLSKLARLVECFARRLQVQERLTVQIADALVEHLAPAGVGVIVTASHSCMAARGVNKTADMVTSALRGAMASEPAARSELLALHHGAP